MTWLREFDKAYEKSKDEYGKDIYVRRFNGYRMGKPDCLPIKHSYLPFLIYAVVCISLFLVSCLFDWDDFPYIILIAFVLILEGVGKFIDYIACYWQKPEFYIQYHPRKFQWE